MENADALAKLYTPGLRLSGSSGHLDAHPLKAENPWTPEFKLLKLRVQDILSGPILILLPLSVQVCHMGRGQ